MIAINNVLVSDQLIKEQFICDLSKCKGACCVDGDAGAPLNKKELKKVDEVFDHVYPYLSSQSIEEINKQGRYVYDKEFGWVTPTINNAVCVYGIKDAMGIVKCGIEQAYLDGKNPNCFNMSFVIFNLTDRISILGSADFISVTKK